MPAYAEVFHVQEWHMHLVSLDALAEMDRVLNERAARQEAAERTARSQRR